MAKRDGGIGPFAGKQQRHGFADNVAAADDNGALAGRLDATAAQQLHNTRRRTGHKRVLAKQKLAERNRMEAVDVLLRGNGTDDLLLVEATRQRKLNQDAVHARILIEAGNGLQKGLLGRIRRKPNRKGRNATLDARPLLCRHIRNGSGIVAEKNDGKSGADTACNQSGCRRRNFGADVGGNLFSIDTHRLENKGTALRRTNGKEQGQLQNLVETLHGAFDVFAGIESRDADVTRSGIAKAAAGRGNDLGLVQQTVEKRPAVGSRIEPDIG